MKRFNLLREVLVWHHVKLLWRRFGDGHKEDIDARLSGQCGSVLQVVRRPAIDQHNHHPGVASPRPILLGEEGLCCVHDGFTCKRANNKARNRFRKASSLTLNANEGDLATEVQLEPCGYGLVYVNCWLIVYLVHFQFLFCSTIN